ncbi:MAG: hypothetical protein HYZ96_00195 [Candidatus Omnitrophica bacterium]|nr:hypothetical protein [Candidatus Omnitrophota bacterium]
MTTATFSDVLQRFTARYRTRLLLKAVVLAALGGGVVAVLAWRLHRLRVSPVWAIGAPGLLGLAAAASLGGWLRRRWMSRQGGAAYLDRTLRLQQRLITAEEFAHAAPAPLLYPLLIEDVGQRVSAQGVRFPKPWDRAAMALAALLLVLLLWPLRGGSVLQQLAQLPRTPPSSPPPEMPPPPEEERQEPGASQRQSAGSSVDQTQSSQQGQSSSSEGGVGQQRSQRSSGQGSTAGTADGRAGEGTQSGRTSDRSGDEQEPGAAEDASRAGERGAPREEDAASRQRQQEGGAQGQQEGGSQAAGGARDQSARQGKQAQAGGAQRDQAAASASAEARSGRGGGMSSADQEALRAEIQELLQEVSGELKQLQAQLAEAQGDTAPSPGTSTDPELYEAPMPLSPEAEGSSPVPMSLGTDTAETRSTRPGGGVGEPSDRVSSEAPGAQAEEVQLSDTPLDERAATRQVVPPEYREVFDRLHRDQPSERHP